MKQLVMLAIVPSEPLRSELRKMQEEYVAQVGGEKALSQPPHITLVHPCLVGDIDSLREKISTLCKTHFPFTLKLPAIGYFRHHPTLYYSVAPAKELQRLHEELLEIMREVREPSYTSYYRHARGRAGDLLREYGSEYVKERYFPHLSLTRNDCDKEKFADLIRNLPFSVAKEFSVDKVSLLVQNGAEWEIVSEIELG